MLHLINNGQNVTRRQRGKEKGGECLSSVPFLFNHIRPSREGGGDVIPHFYPRERTGRKKRGGVAFGDAKATKTSGEVEREQSETKDPADRRDQKK